MRFMLAPRSVRAKHSSILGKSHGMRNLPGFPSFSGNVLRRTAEQCSFSKVLANSYSLSLLQSTNGRNNGLNDGSNNGLKILDWIFNLDNRRLDAFGAFVISKRHRVTFYYLRMRRRGSRNRGSLICISTSSGNTLQILLRVSNDVTWESSLTQR
nr:hypothetical protein [Tanacetum cinerariifolium]